MRPRWYIPDRSVSTGLWPFMLAGLTIVAKYLVDSVFLRVVILMGGAYVALWFSIRAIEWLNHRFPEPKNGTTTRPKEPTKLCRAKRKELRAKDRRH